MMGSLLITMIEKTRNRPRSGSNSLTARAAAGVLATSIVFSAMAQEAPGDGVYKDRIDWGVMMDLSGPTAANEVPWTNGAKAYIRKINDEGGIHGRKLKHFVRDDQYNPAQTKVVVKELVEKQGIFYDLNLIYLLDLYTESSSSSSIFCWLI